MKKTSQNLILILLPLLMSACGTSDTLDEQSFEGNPTDSMPFAQDTYCKPDSNGNYDEKAQMSSGTTEGMAGFWAETGSCILRPVYDLWAAAHNSGMYHWNSIDKTDLVVREDLPDGVSHFYEANHEVKKAAIAKVKWTLYWFHSFTGTMTKPLSVLINFQKVKGNGLANDHIRYWKGTVSLKKITDTVSEFKIRIHIDATNTEQPDTESAANQVFDKIKTLDPHYNPISGGSTIVTPTPSVNPNISAPTVEELIEQTEAEAKDNSALCAWTTRHLGTQVFCN